MKKYIILCILFFLVIIYFYLNFDFDKRIISPDKFILLHIRLPKLLVGLLVGTGLSIVGGLYQGLFKNPLAEPYLLGVSSGSAFGAVISFYFNLHKIPVIGYYLLIVNSFCSGLLVVGFIFMISNYRQNLNLMYLLLAGVIINTLLFSIEYIIISLSIGKMQNVLLWLWGSLPELEYRMILLLAVIIVSCCGVIIFQFKTVNLLSISREFLISKGINLKKTTTWLFLVSTLIVAAITSLCGIIGFVGLIVPHVVRLLTGNDFKKIFLLSLLFGPVFLLFSDLLNNFIFYPLQVPLGMITTVTGAPLFFYLLRRNMK